MSVPLVMLLGATTRCGSNYLYELMRRHPTCHALESEIPEDHLLAHAELLDDYAWLCGGAWCQLWKQGSELERAAKVERFRAEILRALGRGLEQMLVGKAGGDGREALIKTPSPAYLPMLRELFGGVRVVLLYRDGRDVAESMHKSFHLAYERCFQRWCRQAGIMRKFMEADRGPHHVVAYERLVADPGGVMEGLLDFLGWDRAAYPWDRIGDVDIMGSSEDFAQGWVRSEKRPLRSIGRWQCWPQDRVRRFWWVCGGEMKALGYGVGPECDGSWERWKHRCLDLTTEVSEFVGGWVDCAAQWWVFTRFCRKSSWPLLKMRRVRESRMPAGEILYR